MNNSTLTETIEKKIISIINELEAQSSKDLKPIDSRPYFQLADLYNFHKNFKAEAAILNRLITQERADHHDLMDIYARIERATQLSEVVDDNPEPIKLNQYVAQKHQLELVPEITDKDEVSLKTKSKVTPRQVSDKIPFDQKHHKVLTVCAVCTGRTDSDEVIQLALVLFSYFPNNEKPFHTLETFVGNRKTLLPVPNDTQMQFNLKSVENKTQPFDTDTILALFESADFVVSHNDGERERKLIATLIPEVADKPWYSSQKDIPWAALGFKNNHLTQLAISLKERAPRSSLERAVAISRILQKKEVESSQTYLERLYNMQPMKPFKWTESLTKQHQKLRNAGKVKKIKIGVGVAVFMIIILLAYFNY